MKYLVGLRVTVGIYVDVDVDRKKDASAAAIAALNSEDVKQLDVEMVGNPGQFEYDHTVGTPHCTRIWELDDEGMFPLDEDGQYTSGDYWHYAPAKFYRKEK